MVVCAKSAERQKLGRNIGKSRKQPGLARIVTTTRLALVGNLKNLDDLIALNARLYLIEIAVNY